MAAFVAQATMAAINEYTQENSDMVYVFDLDGVITDPQDTSVDEAVVGYIAHILEKGGHVAVNTGRSFAWVKQTLLGRLTAVAGAEFFERLYIVGEKGGESMIWQDSAFVAQPSRFALSSDAAQITRRLYEARKDNLHTMFWDASKQTMATFEKYPEASLDAFKDEQAAVVQQLYQGLEGKSAKIDVTTVAIDIESPLAGKHAGAELIYEWVARNTAIAHDTFICFGDSVSDYEMARYFGTQGAKTTFVYVGEPPAGALREEPGVVLVRTKALYAAGTREYFQQANTSA
jgi:hydroxymethylpyrimidine pyrophosphatase-like HAD family hydrolase